MILISVFLAILKFAYATCSTLIAVFLSRHKTAAALKKAIKAIKKINGMTPTNKALKNSLKSFLKKDRSDADNVSIFYFELIINIELLPTKSNHLTQIEQGPSP